MKVFAFSKALYSTWIYLEPMRLLLDAGEGVNFFLEGRLLAFRDLAITHAHTDHFTGLQNILITRLREQEVTGEPIPPLHIYYPADSHTLERYFDYLKDVIAKWSELAVFCPMNPGDTLALQGARNLYLTALKADHRVYRQTALSYRVEQKRHSLKPEFQGKPQSEINKIVSREGRDAVTEPVMRPLVYYSGDGKPVLDERSRGAALHIQETTFLETHAKADHAGLPEAIGAFRELEARQLLLFHLSSRYTMREFWNTLDHLVPDPEERERIRTVKPGSLFTYDFHIPGF